jgi:uncharacterized protein with PIN domain
MVVDEHMPLTTVGTLRLLGQDVRDIRGTPEERMRDGDLWEMTRRETRLFITTDKGSHRTARHRAMGDLSSGFNGRIGPGFTEHRDPC